MSDSAARILIDYTNEKTEFFLINSSDGTKAVTLEPDGKIGVDHGTSRIEFVRTAGSPWHFRGFRYEPMSGITHGPIRSIEITQDSLTIVDDNRNETQKTIAYRYEIQIQLPDGSRQWIDPVIENRSGTGNI